MRTNANPITTLRDEGRISYIYSLYQFHDDSLVVGTAACALTVWKKDSGCEYKDYHIEMNPRFENRGGNYCIHGHQ